METSVEIYNLPKRTNVLFETTTQKWGVQDTAMGLTPVLPVTTGAVWCTMERPRTETQQTISDSTLS
jgi:hypothetical protein